MDNKKIMVLTENGKQLEVLVTSMKADAIWVLIGDFKCKLLPTRNGMAYAGSVMGREIIYERSVKQVQADLAGEKREMLNYRIR